MILFKQLSIPLGTLRTYIHICFDHMIELNRSLVQTVKHTRQSYEVLPRGIA